MPTTDPVQPMRVLFVLPRIVAGGVERATLNLIDGLQRRGIRCQLALGRCHGELLDEACRTTSVVEVAGGHPARWLSGLRRVIRAFGPTHVVTAFVDVSLLTLLAMRLSGSPAFLVIGVHGTQRREAIEGGWRVRARFAVDTRLAPHAYARAQAVVAVSEGVAADLRQNHPAIGDRLAMIYSPVLREDLGRSAALPSARARRAPFRLVAVGRLAFEKGFDVLVRAMPLVRAQLGACLEIHGEGVERRSLQRQIHTMGLQDNVRLMGATRDPLGVIGEADLFVFPSRNEGFGVALVEALACGQQIVASDCFHGPAEILEHGRHGQLVPPGDASALAAAIIRSLRGEVLFDSGALRRRAADFSSDDAVSRYLSLLAGLGHGRRD